MTVMQSVGAQTRKRWLGCAGVVELEMMVHHMTSQHCRIGNTIPNLGVTNVHSFQIFRKQTGFEKL